MFKNVASQLILRSVSAFFIALMLMIFSVGSANAAGGTSIYCPTLSGNVTVGSSVTINVSNCDGPTNFGMGYNGSILQPQHGSFVLTAQENITGNQNVIYTHNGDSATSDSFQLIDDNGDFVTVNITIAPDTSSIIVTPTSLPSMFAGTPFSQALSSSGGTGPYTYTLQSGSLPLGFNLTGGGLISGTTNVRGTYNFTIRSTDSLSVFSDKTYTGSVAPGNLILDTPTGTAGQGVAFSQTLSASGGVAPYSYLLETGSFPAGISISPSGVVSGTTNASTGSYPVTLRVTDSSTGVGTHFELETYTLTVAALPTVTMSVTPSSVSEDGATNLVYTVTRSVSSASPLTVNITTAGTATSGSDYTGSVATVVIPANATTATITIDPTVDGTIEPDETVTLIVASGSGYIVGAPSSAMGTILNDDVPVVSLSVTPPIVLEDGAPNIVYSFTLNQAANNAISVNFNVGGTATSGVDYAAVISPLVIPAGQTVGTITINPTADSAIETDEAVVITIAAGAGYTIGAQNSLPATIQNDDLPNLTINDATLNEGNSGTNNLTFTVSLSAPAGPGGVTFDISTSNGTALAGNDYVANNLTGQTIAQGSSTYTFTVQLNGDALNEPSESLFVNVTNITNANVADAQGLGTIVNDDPLPSLSIDDVTVTEGNSGTVNASFTVSLSAASGQTVSVNYATANGTASSASDYTNTSGTLTFTPGQTIRTLIVPVNGDTTPEANETFTVGLSGETNASILDSSGLGTITNDDIPVTISPVTLPNGTVAAAYSQTLTSSGGTSPYSYSVTAGALPAGLSLSGGGVLSGTPTAGGTFNFTITSTDSSGAPGPYSASRAYSLVINSPTISLPSKVFSQAIVTNVYSNSITAASGGTAPYSYAVTAGALPTGLSLNASSGAITGTPTTIGTFNFAVTATDSSTGTGPYNGVQNYSIQIIDQAPVANAVSQTVAYGSSGNTISLNITAGTAASVAIGTAATHGTATATGTSISYTPNAGYAGSDSFTYTATNTTGTSSPATVTITVSDPIVTITAGGSLSGTAGTAYSQTFTFNGGAQPWSNYQVTNLPSGVTITGSTANSVTISGAPSVSGTFNMNVSATDSSTGNGPYSVGQVFVLGIGVPTITLSPATVPNGVVASAYSQTLSSSGGAGPYAYAVTSGALPNGLTLSNAGVLSGTPTASGTFNFTVTATDNNGFTGNRAYSVTIAAPVINITPEALASGMVASSYSQNISAAGSFGPYSFNVSAGALPAGLTLASNGTLSGTPTAGGVFNFTITATDSSASPGPYTGTKAYSLNIAAPTIVLPATILASGIQNQAYNASLNPASGGTAPYRYSVTAGALPTGVTLTSTGTLSGTPTVFGNFSFTVTATDSSGGTGPYSGTRAYNLQIGEQAPIAQNVSQSVAYGSGANNITLNIGGGTATSVAIGTAPTHGTAIATGTSISYTPNVGYAGSDSFTYTASNVTGTSSPATISINVGNPSLSISASGSLNGIVGQTYSQTFTFAGGNAPYTTYNVTGLPSGLTQTLSTNNSVTISGTPRAQGTFALSVSGTDSSTGVGPFNISQNFSLQIGAPVLSLSPNAGNLSATYATPYSQSFSASGGIGPYQYAVTGTLPNGVTLNTSTGALTGTPTQTGSFNFAIKATDTGSTGSGAPFFVQNNYTLNIAAPTIAVTPTTLNAGVAGTAYNAALSSSGGVGPYIYSLTSGALPNGMTMAANGQISGTPTRTGTFSFIVQSRDANGQTGSASLSITINVGTLIISPSTLPNGAQGIAYSQTLTVSGGIAPYVFAVSSGSLPQGLSLNTTTGVISGTPSSSGAANFAITVTDSTAGTAASATITYAMQVIARPEPANDVEVKGLVQAQTTATRRFATVQLNNFTNRLEGMHGGGAGGGGFQNSLSVTTTPYCVQSAISWTKPGCSYRNSLKGIANSLGANAVDDGANAGGGGNDMDNPWTFWAGGTIRYGDIDQKIGIESQDFESEGVSFGVDRRFSDKFAAGIGLGFGSDNVDIGTHGSFNKGDAKTIAIYASHQFNKSIYIDWLGGYQSIEYDIRRYVTSSGLFVNSNRKGDQWFASVSAGADINKDNWQLTPYARFDMTNATLDGYAENSGSIFDLRFLEQKIKFNSLAIGTKFRSHIEKDWGQILPQFRIEFQNDLEQSSDAKVSYIDQLVSPNSVIPISGIAKSQITLGAGAEFIIGDSLTIQFEYQTHHSSGINSDQGLQISVRKQF